MRSMTGYGQGAAEGRRLRASVTLRGFNHRYLDLALKLRDELRDLEPALRELLTGRLHRGRVEATIEIGVLDGGVVEVRVDEELAARLHAVQQELLARGLVSDGLSFADLLRLPQVVTFDERPVEWGEEERSVVLEAASSALEQFVTARSVEGEKLHATFLPRLDALAELTEKLAARRAEVAAETLESLRQRIRELLAGEPAGERLTEDRLAQEAALYVDKSDVAEELDRLGSHLEHFRAVMAKEGSVGKRLDFIAQEVFRELNTLGAKCRDSTMLRWVLDGKVLCEQIREQVQNVE